MRDGPILSVFKRLTAGCYAIDVRISRLVIAWREGKPPYELRGSCNDCGRCCETPMIMVPAPVFRLRFLRKSFLWWHRRVNGFLYVGDDRESRAFVFTCSHWDGEKRRCDCYSTRPGMCRDYPRALVQSTKPEFFKECGFHPVYRNADLMREALQAEGLPPEKLRDLEEKLHLRE